MIDIQVIRDVPLFENLTTAQLRKIAAIATVRKVPVGEVIFRDASPGDEMYVIVEGRVRISKSVPTVGEEALAVLKPGSHFGEMAIIDGSPRSADAVAHHPCALAVIRKDALDKLMFLDRELGFQLLWNFVRTLSARLRETNEKIKFFFAVSRFE